MDYTEMVRKRLLAKLTGENNAAPEKKTYIDRIIFNNPATVILWSDGEKTVVKCQPGDEYDPLTGALMCIAKRCFGNKGAYNDVLRLWVPGYGEEECE